MLNLKMLTLVIALLLSIAAAFRAWTHEQARTQAIKQTITVTPGTAAAISGFHDR